VEESKIAAQMSKLQKKIFTFSHFNHLFEIYFHIP